VDHFIQKKSKELSIYPPPTLGPGAIDELMSYHWPGNVRELENVVERELILYRKGPLSFNNFNMSAIHKKPDLNREEETALPLDEVVTAHIFRVLKMTGGRVSGPKGAAKILSVHPNTLRNRMVKLGIPFRKAEWKEPG
jgi:DNA-binding NtrC family response regulator